MSQNETPKTPDTETETRTDAKGSIADSVFDIGMEWAAYGLTAGKNALEVSATTLIRTAGLLARVRDELSAKNDEAKPSEPKAA